MGAMVKGELCEKVVEVSRVRVKMIALVVVF